MLAAQCWCDDETKDRVMDPALAEAFAKRLAILVKRIAIWKEIAKEANRVILLYQRWEQAGDIEIEKDVDIDPESMLIEASFAAQSFSEKWKNYDKSNH